MNMHESSGNTVDIRAEQVEPPSWGAALSRYIEAVLRHLNIRDREISFLLTDDQFMTNLNSTYRGLNETTDVLSFGGDDDGSEEVLGDVVISLPRVEEQAGEVGVPYEEELRRVTIHGILHLAGMDHGTNEMNSEPMLQTQEEILRTLKERLF